jgi:hypothetical protein
LKEWNGSFIGGQDREDFVVLAAGLVEFVIWMRQEGGGGLTRHNGIWGRIVRKREALFLLPDCILKINLAVLRNSKKKEWNARNRRNVPMEIF